MSKQSQHDLAEPKHEWTTAQRDALTQWAQSDPPAALAEQLQRAIGGEPVAGPSENAPLPTATAKWKRWLPAAAAGSAVAAAFVIGRLTLGAASSSQRQGPASGVVVSAPKRHHVAIGNRAVAVAEEQTEMTWTVDGNGRADVHQHSGSVFYRVDRGESFVVHTDAGDIRVTGTCFNVEVKMSAKQKLVSGAIGAIAAAAVVVTVYEGGVVVANTRGQQPVAAGQTATLPAVGNAQQPIAVAATAAPGQAAAVSGSATSVAAMTEAQLRERVAALEAKLATATAADKAKDAAAYEGIRPSTETLQAWAKQCRIRVDHPPYHSLTPPIEKGNPRISADDLPHYNAAMAEVHKALLASLRAAYVEVTGDQAGALTLPAAGMEQEVDEKSGDEETAIRTRIANERAGNVPPPAAGATMSALERYYRNRAALGDDTEAALAKRVGAARAREIRGEEGWGGMNGHMMGCAD